MADRSSLAAGGRMTAERALRLAWRGYVLMLLLPFVLFVAVMWRLMGNEMAIRSTPLGQNWFIVCMAYMLLAVPASFFWRSHVFKGYWRGKPVEPGRYLRGMLTMWVTIEIGGMLSLVACLVSGSLLPNLLPALLAFALFTPLWPSGYAMTRPVGGADDPEVYAEPR